MQFLTQRVRGSSNNAAVITMSEDSAATAVSGRDKCKDVVANPSAIVGENNETATTATNGADDGGSSRCRCISGSGAPTHCRNDTQAAAFRCRRDHDAAEKETVVCLPMFVDSRRSTSFTRDVTPRNGPSVGSSDVTDECSRTEVEEDDDEAWTTTSGSYNAGDLCDEIDQLFFAQNHDRNFVSASK